jgi:uncharacterized membrane protein YeaQ/YmgE (transglycosylase-associated protein family)
MNPGIGILGWIIIGALAGWIGSKVMGTDAQQGGLANIGIGVLGAILGGFITRRFFGADLGHNGLIASFGVALLGSCLVILAWKTLRGRRA